MNQQDGVFVAVTEISSRIADIYNAAYTPYLKAVDTLVANPLLSSDRAEHLLDGLLDFCDDVRFVCMYKEVCRHLYRYYPEIAVDYVKLLLKLYETGNESNEHDNDNPQTSD